MCCFNVCCILNSRKRLTKWYQDEYHCRSEGNLAWSYQFQILGARQPRELPIFVSAGWMAPSGSPARQRQPTGVPGAEAAHGAVPGAARPAAGSAPAPAPNSPASPGAGPLLPSPRTPGAGAAQGARGGRARPLGRGSGEHGGDARYGRRRCRESRRLRGSRRR